MYFQIAKLVLWPRNPNIPPRVVQFRPGLVNVITGASKTGKSAFIPIVDYCLGADRCAIPVQTIRNSCSWFGIVVDTCEGQKLLARREPGDQQSTSDMFVLESATVEIPHTIERKNSTSDAVKRVLDKLAQLTNLSIDPSGLRPFGERPGFRDLMAFTFQPQNIVANPDVLFFKADTTEHREKLKSIFPYVLGAMTPDLLAKLWERDRLVKELRRKEREVSARDQISETWKAEALSWLSEARDFGLVPADISLEMPFDEVLHTLDRVSRRTSADAHLSVEALDRFTQEARDLEREESKVAALLATARSRLNNMMRLSENVDLYTGALCKQRDRLALARWMRDMSVESRCPICHSEFEGAQSELDAMCDSLAEIEASVRLLTPVPAAFSRELATVKEQSSILSERLQAVRLRRRKLEARSEETKWDSGYAAGIDRFIGRTEQAVKYLLPSRQDGELAAAVAALRAEIDRLKHELSESRYESRLHSALSQVSGFISRMLPLLDCERPDDPVELSINDLTVRVHSRSGRTDSLWEIGSGANWLSYHVSVMLALQLLFVSEPVNPVPGFLVLDQPSQVYFPQKLASNSEEGHDPEFGDEDIIAIRKVFEILGKCTQSRAMAGRLQVIVLDHAGTNIWEGVQGIHLVEEWRGQNALVPLSWLEALKEA